MNFDLVTRFTNHVHPFNNLEVKAFAIESYREALASQWNQEVDEHSYHCLKFWECAYYLENGEWPIHIQTKYKSGWYYIGPCVSD